MKAASAAGKLWRGAVTAGSAASAALAAQALLNSLLLRTPHDSLATDTISVLLPARDEAATITACIESVLTQDGVGELIVLDDGSTDGTGEILAALAQRDPRLRVIESSQRTDPPANWLGKSWACHRLAKQATGTALVFIDADVVLEPGSLGRAVTMMRELKVDLVSPYPRQLADHALPRLVQPLLQWSWLTFVPLRLSETVQPASMAVANGQFLVVDAAQYDRIGGHASVANQVLEDVALARVVRQSGGRTAVVDGTDLATCRMYGTNAELVEGYTKSLWSAFGSRRGAFITLSLLKIAYVLPPLAMAVGPDRRTRRIGAFGYVSAVAGRAVVAQRTDQRTFPDALAHPLSITALSALTALSFRRKAYGQLTWKSRTIL